MRKNFVAICALALVVLMGGLATTAHAQSTRTISSNIVVSDTWGPNEEIILDGIIYIEEGVTLDILPGTVVRGLPNDPGDTNPGTLVATRGAKLNILGTKEKPVVFTDQFDDNLPGNPFFGNNPPTPPYDTADNAEGLTAQWGGLIALGRTYVSDDTETGPNPDRTQQIEGLTPDGGLGLYGGCSAFFDLTEDPSICDDDDSGTMRYFSIRYGGFNLSAANEINGLTLGGVGRETEIEYAEIFQNQDDGVEFFGGTVHTKRVAITNVGDDSIDQDEGFRGCGQYYFVMNGPIAGDQSDKGGELDGGDSGDGSQPFAIPTFSNVTMIGLGNDSGRDSNTAKKFRDNAGGRWINSAFLDFGGAPITIEGGSSTVFDPNTSCERTITDFPPALYDSFYHPDFSDSFLNRQLEIVHSTYYCFGNGGIVPTGEPECSTAGGDKTCCDLENGGLFGGAHNNEYLDCASDLPIRQLDRVAGTGVRRVETVDPRPAAGSPLLTGAFTDYPDNGCVEPTDFRGAFKDNNWLRGWSTLDRLGYFPNPADNVITVGDDITTSQTWTKDNIYELDNVTYVREGATLTIEPGTIVRGQPNTPGETDPGTIVITRGAKIDAVGNAHMPIVFTDLFDDNVPGNETPTPPYDTADNAEGLTAQWGGVIMLGTTYVSDDTESGPNPDRTQQIEGLTPSEGRGLYGGCSAFYDPSSDPAVCDDDDSGRLQYFSIRYGGFNLSAANEINGLTLGGVGRETEIGFGEVFQNQDDGVEFFGGTLHINNMIIANVGDDSVDQDEGFRGGGQHVFVLNGPIAGDQSDKGGELDGGDSGDGSQPFAIPQFANVTMIGLGKDSGRDSNTALKFRDNAGGHWFKSFFADFGGAPTTIEGGSSSQFDPLTSCERTISAYPPTSAGDLSLYLRGVDPSDDVLNQLEIRESTFFDFGNGGIVPTGEPECSTAGGDKTCCDLPNGGLFGNTDLDNEYLDSGSGAALPIRTLVRVAGSGVQRIDKVDPRPAPGSTLTTSGATSRTFASGSDSPFEPTSYRGAFSESTNWAFGWSVLDRLGYFPVCDPADPDLDDAIPNPAQNLRFLADSTSLIEWDGVARAGDFTRYDVLVSADPANFGSATCAESGDVDTQADIADDPATGTASFILVRSLNECGGTLGGDWGGLERSGVTCSP